MAAKRTGWRSRIPVAIAVLSSAAALILALLPARHEPHRYDAGLAVLTATLVAIIWYTFFTFGILKKAEDEGTHRDLEAKLIRVQLEMLLEAAGHSTRAHVVPRLDSGASPKLTLTNEGGQTATNVDFRVIAGDTELPKRQLLGNRYDGELPIESLTADGERSFYLAFRSSPAARPHSLQLG